MRTDRRKFLKLFGGSFLVGFAFLWDRMVRNDRNLAAIKRVTIPYNPNEDFIFHKDFVVINQNKNPKVFSSRCTHLGCIIQGTVDGKLVCPCHGSTFNPAGYPEKGPAIEPLKQLTFQYDEAAQQITVEI